jgi:1-deoxy-D-xylulose-5-phosphate reductoisomerase
MPDSISSPLGRPRRVTVLGSTGSIGRAACDVIARMPGRLELFALAAGSNVELLAEQVRILRPRVVALARADLETELRSRLGAGWSGALLFGPTAAESVAAMEEADVVLNGLVGAAGLRPTWRALRAGRTIALANKESLVIAGEFLADEARRGGARLLPVDSEHNAIFQALGEHDPSWIRRLILTASGGPLRERDAATLGSVTPAEALKHPTWSMGPRITIDSATLLNKGFEVIEAHWLFSVPPERIEVWIHPQSIVHGLVEWVDGSTTAVLSSPDMRIPIQNALCYPERLDGPVPACDLTVRGRLDFARPEPARYPCLALARRALAAGGTAAAALNAADEVLVAAFLDGRIAFPRIAEGLERVLDLGSAVTGHDLDAVLEADRWARAQAESIVSAWG